MTRAAWTGARVLLTIAIIASVLRGFDLIAATIALGRFSSIALEEALVLIAVDRALMFWRWLVLIRVVSSAPLHQLARIFFVSSFLGSFLPSGIGGDAARAFQVGRQINQAGAAVASVVVDRWLGLIAVGISGCAGVLASLAAVPDELRELTIITTILLITSGVATLYADRVVGWLLPPANGGGRLTVAIHRLSSALALYRRYPRELWLVGGLSLAVQAVRITLAWAIGSGLGITLPFSYYWVFMPLNILIILLPLSLGGFGLPQGTMVWTLGPLGVAPTEAFLLSLLFVLAGVVGNLPGALLYAFGPSRDKPTGGGRQVG
ncbi:MAG: lysylphosphatidylglycerol synthase transmembrane domain-containing protein [Vicinamibacterales bacterium]